MKMYRRGTHTDTKSPADYVGWEPGHIIPFSGTIDKSGERHTYLRLRIEEEDVVALFMAFLRSNPQRLFELLADGLNSQEEKINRLRKAGSVLRVGLKRLRGCIPEEARKEVDKILAKEREGYDS